MVSAEKQITSTTILDSEWIQSTGQINLPYPTCCGKNSLPTRKALANLFSRGVHWVLKLPEQTSCFHG